MATHLSSNLTKLAAVSLTIGISFYVVYLERPGCGCLDPSCMSNERMIGFALQQYAQDNDEAYPPIQNASGNRTWRNIVIGNYVSDLAFTCPAEPVTPIGPDGVRNDYFGNYSGRPGPGNPYAGMGFFSGPGQPVRTMSQIPHPELLIAVCDGAGKGPAVTIGSGNFDPSGPVISAPHNGEANFLFADGHVSRQKPSQTYSIAAGSTHEQIKEPHYFHDPYQAKPFPDSLAVNLWYTDPSRPLSPSGRVRLNADRENEHPRNWLQNLLLRKVPD